LVNFYIVHNEYALAGICYAEENKERFISCASSFISPTDSWNRTASTTKWTFLRFRTVSYALVTSRTSHRGESFDRHLFLN